MSDCPICFNEDYTNIGIVNLSCGHKFCLDCIRTVYKENDFRCALCRTIQYNLEDISVTFPKQIQTFAEIVGIFYTRDEDPKIDVGILLNDYTDDDNLFNFTDLPMQLNFNHPVRELVWTLDTQLGSQLGSQSTIEPEIIEENTLSNDWFNNQDTPPENNWFDNQGTPPFAENVDNSNNNDNDNDNNDIRPQRSMWNIRPMWNDNNNHNHNHNHNHNDIRPQRNMWNDNNRLHIFTPNYNVFRIMSGMGALAYSN